MSSIILDHPLSKTRDWILFKEIQKGGVKIQEYTNIFLIEFLRVPVVFPLKGTSDTPIGVCPVRPDNISPDA